MSRERKSYRAKDLANNKDIKPQLKLVKESTNGHVPKIQAHEALEGLDLSKRGSFLLRSKSTDGEDRSARLYELGAILFECGATPDQAFVVLRDSVWNKFQGRSDEVERLWEAVDRIRDSHDADGTVRGISSNTLRSAVRVDTLLARQLTPPQWLVGDIWERRGWGFVAGEPKTYKSTFTTDLAISVATGRDFLNHFPVEKTGPVLIVQEENSVNIQQGRIRRISEAKQLGGKVHSVNGKCAEITFPIAKDEFPLYCIDRSGFSFSSKRKLKQMRAEIKAIEPVLVVFDPIQRMMGDLNIRNELDVTRALEWLDGINNDYRVSTLLVHHYRKTREEGPQEGGQRMLGSQALHAWLTCGLYLRRASQDLLTVSREFRAFHDNGPFQLEFQSEDEGDFYNVSVMEQAPRGTKTQHELIDLVTDRPWQTASEYAKVMGVERSTMVERLKRLPLKTRKKKNPSGRGRPILLYGPTNQDD
jgi:hypothetical protein